VDVGMMKVFPGAGGSWIDLKDWCVSRSWIDENI